MENKDLMAELRDVLVNEPAERHSYFQMKYFIVGKEPTTQSKMWQCIREIKARHDSLEAIELELEEASDNLELIEININRNKAILNKKKAKDINPMAIRISEISLRKSERQMIAAKKNIEALAKKRKYLQEEAKFFVLAFKNLQEVEPLLDYDNLKAQKQYWGEKLLQKINLKMLMQSHVDTELIETVLALPDDIPIKEQTLKNLDVRHRQMVDMKKQAETALIKQETDDN